MPTVNGRSPGQFADVRAMMDWHLDMTARLDRAGKFDLTRLHLVRATC